MVFPREVLNELKWRYDSLDEAEITYVHRGAPGDIMTIKGAAIVALGRSFFDTGDATIPYHRIVRIIWKGTLVFGKY
ncbi:MAG: RNA repair domain-containing protein [Euryarchaeota archaeon]|nr:RNA repair domain-containing protein [Euryarchaeota archaeon]